MTFLIMTKSCFSLVLVLPRSSTSPISRFAALIIDGTPLIKRIPRLIASSTFKMLPLSSSVAPK